MRQLAMVAAAAALGSGCDSDLWDGQIIDIVEPATFSGSFDTEDLNHGLDGDAWLQVDLMPCDAGQCAEFLFDGTLTSRQATLYGPESHRVSGVTIDHPYLWSEFELRDYLVRAEGELLDHDGTLWLEIEVKVPPLGWISVGEITLDGI